MAFTPDRASMTLSVTVCPLLTQPVVALVCRFVALVLGAVVSMLT